MKLFVELFSNKFQPFLMKIMKAANEEEVLQLGKQLEHQLEVALLPSSTLLMFSVCKYM